MRATACNGFDHISYTLANTIKCALLIHDTMKAQNACMPTCRQAQNSHRLKGSWIYTDFLTEKNEETGSKKKCGLYSHIVLTWWLFSLYIIEKRTRWQMKRWYLFIPMTTTRLVHLPKRSPASGFTSCLCSPLNMCSSVSAPSLVCDFPLLPVSITHHPYTRLLDVITLETQSIGSQVTEYLEVITVSTWSFRGQTVNVLVLGLKWPQGNPRKNANPP